MTFSARRAVRWSALAAIAIGCIGCDQVAKSVAISHLKGEAPQNFWGGALRLEYAENPGGFLSLGAQWAPTTRLVVLSVVNGLLMASIAATLVLRWKMPAGQFLGCALLLSGGLGNLIDRVRFDGLVVDFLNLGVGPLRTGIFNVADMAITLGAIVLVFGRTRPRQAPIAAKQA